MVKCCLGLLSVLALVIAPANAIAGPGQIVDVPVSFRVHNTNTSAVACPSDGSAYRVRGHLTGPAKALKRGSRTVTYYLHGFNVDEYMWRIGEVPGYHYATEMAKLGHISVTVSRLGWGASAGPPGEMNCVGSAADVAHQVIARLRSGHYRARGRAPVAFQSIVLAGHDSGATVAEVESYSYDDIDGLIVLDYADTGFTPTVLRFSLQGAADCASGKPPQYPGGPGAYFDLGPANSQELSAAAFPNTDPAVIAAGLPHRLSNPCGELQSITTAVTSNLARLREVEVPVLIGSGDQDLGFSADGVRRQRSLFSGSDDVTVQIYENTGHFPMAGRTAPVFRSMVSAWLTQRYR